MSRLLNIFTKSKLPVNRQAEWNSSFPVMSMYFWVLSFLKPYRFRFTLFMLCGFAATAVDLVIPKAIQILIDDILPHNDIDRFRWLMIGLIPLILLFFGASIIRNILQQFFQEHAVRDLQFSIFRQLRKLGFSYYEKHPAGDTLTLFQTDVSSIQSIYQQYFPQMIHKVIFLILSIALLLSLNWHLSLLIVPSLLSYYLIGS